MMKCCNSRERARGQHCAKDSSRGVHSGSSAARFLGGRERRRDLLSGLIVERVCPSSVFGRLSEYPSDSMFPRPFLPLSQNLLIVYSALSTMRTTAHSTISLGWESHEKNSPSFRHFPKTNVPNSAIKIQPRFLTYLPHNLSSASSVESISLLSLEFGFIP